MVQKGMSQKKFYEIQVFKNKIFDTLPQNVGTLIDVGCGQGHLCEAI